jgi:hypothetical protein
MWSLAVPSGERRWGGNAYRIEQRVGVPANRAMRIALGLFHTRPWSSQGCDNPEPGGSFQAHTRGDPPSAASPPHPHRTETSGNPVPTPDHHPARGPTQFESVRGERERGSSRCKLYGRRATRPCHQSWAAGYRALHEAEPGRESKRWILPITTGALGASASP